MGYRFRVSILIWFTDTKERNNKGQKGSQVGGGIKGGEQKAMACAKREGLAWT